MTGISVFLGSFVAYQFRNHEHTFQFEFFG
jgi:hypothetical protein